MVLQPPPRWRIIIHTKGSGEQLSFNRIFIKWGEYLSIIVVITWSGQLMGFYSSNRGQFNGVIIADMTCEALHLKTNTLGLNIFRGFIF